MAGNSLLFLKLSKIIGEISRVPKRGRNEFHKYDYVTESDLLDAVRSKLSEAHVAYFFSVDSVTTRNTDNAKAGPITEVTVTVTFADADTGETFSVKGAGAGQDAGDKGVYKAITGAQKYVVMKTFLVPTGDDPELDDAQPAKPAKARVASGGKDAGKGQALTTHPDGAAAQAAVAQSLKAAGVAPSVDVEGGDAVIPQGKLQGRTVNSLSLGEAKDLLGKLPKGNRWHALVSARVKALEAAAADPALAAAAEALDLVATK